MAVRDFGPSPEGPEKPHPVAPRKHVRWGRVTAWGAGILLALVVMVLIAADALLSSTSFHNYLLRTIERQASASLNAPVHLQSLAVHLSTLGFDLYGITIDGVGPGASKPLLQVDHVGLSVRIVCLLHRQWNLSMSQSIGRLFILLSVPQARTNCLDPRIPRIRLQVSST